MFLVLLPVLLHACATRLSGCESLSHADTESGLDAPGKNESRHARGNVSALRGRCSVEARPLRGRTCRIFIV